MLISKLDKIFNNYDFVLKKKSVIVCTGQRAV